MDIIKKIKSGLELVASLPFCFEICPEIFFASISTTWVTLMFYFKVKQLQNTETKQTDLNRGRFTNTATSNIQMHIVQP